MALMPNPRDVGKYMALAQVGIEMVVPIVVGLVLDSYLNWTPWGVIVGAAVGLVGGLWHLVVMLNRIDQEREEPPSEEP